MGELFSRLLPITSLLLQLPSSELNGGVFDPDCRAPCGAGDDSITGWNEPMKVEVSSLIQAVEILGQRW